VKSAWLIVSLGLVGGLVGAIYGTATWQDSGELFAPTLFGQAFVDGASGVVVGGMIGLLISVALELWRTLARPGRNGH